VQFSEEIYGYISTGVLQERLKMPVTTDPNDPRLKRGGEDKNPVPQQGVYLVLSEEERQKGFVRPVRHSYRHVGKLPKYPLRDLTDEEKERHPGYAKFEPYPESELPKTGRFWTQAQLDEGKGCGVVTTMGQSIAETYARDPYFYGFTYCAYCQKHLLVEEFVWVDDDTQVGS
jgi:hypothetical protein